MVSDFTEDSLGPFSTARFRKGVLRWPSYHDISITIVFAQPAIFEDIAQEAISLCRQSFVVASDTIRSKNTPSSKLDAPLFLVRHLLILKEITHNLDFAHKDVQPSVDLGGVTGQFLKTIVKCNQH